MNLALLHAVVRLSEAQTPDVDLLARFVRARDEAAFEELVRRHGPLVWSVCRQSLAHHADAEDAFQAVFLALVQGAGRIRAGQALPAWLHGVAVRVVQKARRSQGRRRQREAKAAVVEADRPVPDSAWANLMSAVHEEVQRLPNAERTAFILCELEGVRQPDAATQLGCPLGTLSGRLCKARQRLLDRLPRRGIVPGVLGIGGLAATAGTAPADVVATVSSFPSAVAGGISSTAAALAAGLTEGVTMRTKLLATAILFAGTMVFSGGSMILSNLEAQPPVKEKKVIVDPTIPSDLPGQTKSDNRQYPSGGGGAGAGTPAAGGDPRMGGGMAMGGMPGVAWEYKFVDLKTEDREHFTKQIVQLGTEGWEYCGAEHLRIDAAVDGRILVLVFKKRKGGEFHIMGGFGGGMPGMPGMGPGGGGFGGAQGGFMVGPGGAQGGVVIGPGGPVGVHPGGIAGGGPGVGPVGPGGGAAGGGPGGPPGMAPGFPGGNRMGIAGGPMPRANITLLKLQHAKADEMATVLTQVFGGHNAQITHDPRTNQLIVRAANEETAKEIAALVEKLDVPVAGKGPPK